MSKSKKKKRTKIEIDYSLCGEKGKVDPRNCGLCLKSCDPAVFVMHPRVGTEDKQEDPYDPQDWRITPIWGSLCSRCLKCVEVCPENAITISW
ncbi:MAG: 4Fe-4S binding protein [Candidatus Lokiarchaeota archaeon]|jgi:ferredoxin